MPRTVTLLRATPEARKDAISAGPMYGASASSGIANVGVNGTVTLDGENHTGALADPRFVPTLIDFLASS